MTAFPLKIDDLREHSPGIFYANASLGAPFLADQELILFLKAKVAISPTRRARICAHPDLQAEQHDMLIASHKQTYVAPHKHPTKSETFLILEGFTDLFLFNNDGAVKDVIPMGPPASGRPFFYRMPAQQFHALMITSDVLVFVESTKGPFDLSQTDYAAWAPAPDQTTKGHAYFAALGISSDRR